MVPYTENVRRRSCTILLQTYTVPPQPDVDPPLLGPNDPPPGTHLFTIAQHYFSIPLRKEQLRWWYIREPFEIVCYPHTPGAPAPVEVALPAPAAIQEALANWDIHGDVDGADASGDESEGEDTDDSDNEIAPQFGPEPAPQGTDWTNIGAEAEAEEGAEDMEEPALPVPAPEAAAIPPDHFDDGVAVVPLVAVDFGCAVWLEYVSYGSEDLRVRYVTFPPVDIDRAAEDFEGLSKESDVHTLEVPSEIDLKLVCHIGLDQAQGT